MTRGERVIAFIERFCIVPEGKLIGQPMRLDPFQKEFILAVYDNPAGTDMAILSIARKNGKTGLIAGILLAHLVGPEAVQNTQIVSGALSREQAAIVFNLAVKMVNLNPKLSGVSRGYANWFDEISNVSGTVSDGVKTTLDSAFGNVTSMLEGNKVSWKSWGISVLQIIEKVALQMAVVSAMGGTSSGSGIFGSLIGSVGSFFGGGAGASASTGTAVSSYGSNFQFNAKGGVYDSPSLSAFSNGIVRNPTMFAFAKGGAGIMGEAGPEAIMPLTRAPDGSLGVRAVGGGGGQSVSSAPQVYITIDGNGNTQTQASPGLEQFGAEVGEFVDRRYKQNVMRDIRPGGDIWNAMKGTR
ncbi:phage tail tape measure protein [Enterobacter hormaechei]|uniref:phage tail tape measure protein n=1 Tax=Enterobacter hormaechei TaxID=158836 RepID=UPI00125444FF|nr:phage tail tape measure protein [Enterobacter hormaechei]VAF71623.1 lambda family phage tail tape measure protein [Enterobacter hormaechei]